MISALGIALQWAARVLFLCLFAGTATADEFIEFVVPITNDMRYSRKQLCDQINQKLGAHYPFDSIPEGDFQLSPIEKASLLAADAAGILSVRIEPNQIVLRIDNPEDDATRRKNRQRLERLLGIRLEEWPPGMGLHVPISFDPGARTIVLVHGLESHAAELERFSLACEHWGIQPLLFEYPNDGPPAWSGEHLSSDLKGLAAKYPELRVVIVAHSMGGLVSRYCLETSGKNPGCVTDLFTLGTPHQGSDLAGMQPLVELFTDSFVKGQGAWHTLEDGLGEAGRDLRPKSEFLKTLNNRPRSPDVAYHVGAGRKSLLRPWIRLSAQLLVDEAAARKKLPDAAQQTLTGLLHAKELQDGQGDGAVSVPSALLPGAKDEAVFERNHLELLSLPGDHPEDNEVFRWIVDKLGWTRQESKKP